jgi:GTPase SAR1 family protein
MFIEAKDLPETCGDVKEHVTMSVWDFSGKQMYHGIHQFFITNRAIYLVVFALGCPKETWGLIDDLSCFFRRFDRHKFRMLVKVSLTFV